MKEIRVITVFASSGIFLPFSELAMPNVILRKKEKKNFHANKY